MSAIISQCGTYRYRLERELALRVGPTVLWIMLNPSTADADHDDPTIRKVAGFSRLAGYARLIVVNLFAMRATDPRDVLLNLADAEGSENCRHIMEAAVDASAIVCAWGAAPWAEEQARAVCGWLDDLDHAPPGLCLGTTKSGAPKHPLYVPYAQPFVPFHGYAKAVRS